MPTTFISVPLSQWLETVFLSINFLSGMFDSTGTEISLIWLSVNILFSDSFTEHIAKSDWIFRNIQCICTGASLMIFISYFKPLQTPFCNQKTASHPHNFFNLLRQLLSKLWCAVWSVLMQDFPCVNYFRLVLRNEITFPNTFLVLWYDMVVSLDNASDTFVDRDAPAFLEISEAVHSTLSISKTSNFVRCKVAHCPYTSLIIQMMNPMSLSVTWFKLLTTSILDRSGHPWTNKANSSSNCTRKTV